MDETFSSIDLITQCLLDEKRTLKFKGAIEKAVKPGDIVLDAGTGSAILAFFAARAGAKRVIAVEFDPYIAQLALKNVKNNGYEEIIKIYLGDVRDMHFDKGTLFDVVIMEMLTTGMIDEYQVWAMNNLHKNHFVKDSTTFIPQRQDTFISLAETNFDTYGFQMRMVKHLWEPFPPGECKPLTDTQSMNSISFDRENPITSISKNTFKVQTSGVLNSLYVTSQTVLDAELYLEDTLSLNAPVVVPLEKDYAVSEGDRVECSIEYEFGNGFRNFRPQIRVL